MGPRWIRRTLDPRFRSLVRSNAVVLVALLLTFWISDFPHNRATVLLALPLLLAVAGTVDTVRCLQPRWSLYHGGVLLSLYMDIMAVAMCVFAWLYPYVEAMARR